MKIGGGDTQINLTVWAQMLVDHDIDERARMEFFLLSQHSVEVYKAANSIVAKLLKKASEYEVMRKPSAFVHSCVVNARDQIGW